MKCFECGETMRKRGYQHTTLVGRFPVTDGTAMVATCENCGEVTLTAEQLSGYERRAARVVLTDAQRVGGPELKFVRKALGLRQKDIAALLGSSETEPSRWENSSEDAPKWLRLALIGLLDEAEKRGIDRVNEIGSSDSQQFRVTDEIRKAV